MTNRSRNLLVVLALGLVASVALAGPSILQRNRVAFMNGVFVATGSRVATSGNLITQALGASSSIDFAGVTDTCEDSSAITVTGAAAGDPCIVGSPATMPHANSWTMCYVSATNAVKVRHCAHGASGNPAAATYYVRVISSQ